MPCPRRAHAVPLPCRAAKGLECVFPIRFTQCGRVWFTLAMPCPCHAPTIPFFSIPQHSTAVERRPCCAVVLRRTAWPEHGMASVNQTRPHCVNLTGKTHFKPLAARHGRGTAWARHAICKSALNRIQLPLCNLHFIFAIKQTPWPSSIRTLYMRNANELQGQHNKQITY